MEKKELVSIGLFNRLSELSEYQKNIFGILSGMSITDQKTIAFNSLYARVQVGKSCETITYKLINQTRQHILTLEEIIKIEAYFKTYFGELKSEGNEQQDLSDKFNFVSELNLDKESPSITMNYSIMEGEEIKERVLFELPIPKSLLRHHNSKLVLTIYFIITNYVEVLLTGEL